MSHKGFLKIGIIILVVVLVGVLASILWPKKTVAPSATQVSAGKPEVPDIGAIPVSTGTSGMEIFSGTRGSFFEGMNTFTFEIQYDSAKFTVLSADYENPTVLKDTVGKRYEILTTFEDARGFTPRDYWENNLRQNCNGCALAGAPATLAAFSDAIMAQNQDTEWIIFFPKNSGGLFIATFPRSSPDAEKMLSTVRITDSKSQQPASQVSVYFVTNQASSTLCNGVTSTIRYVLKVPGIETETITELLKGPTDHEKTEGDSTQIPAGSILNSLRIDSGVAYADFNETAQSGGGACSMEERTAQIRDTLLQFPSVKSVNISLDGKATDIFQP